MIIWKHETGPLLSWQDQTFKIDDLNPELHVRWLMSRWELFKVGLCCLWAAIRA